MGNNKTKILTEIKFDEKELANDFFDLAGAIFIVLDLNGIVRKINKKGVKMLGAASKEMIIGLNWIDTFVPKEHQNKLISIFENAFLGKGLTEYVENPIITLNGETKIIAWNNSIAKDSSGESNYVISFGHDITARKKMEEELSKAKAELEKRVKERTYALSDEIKERKKAVKALIKSEEKYKNLINNANEFVLLLDRKGYISFANKSFFKYANKKINSKVHYSELINEHEIPKINIIFSKLLKNKNGRSQGEFQARDLNGRSIYINFSATTVTDNKSQISGIQIIARNITAEKLLRREVEKRKEHYAQVVNTIQDGICVIDKDFQILSYNNAFFEGLGENKKINQNIKGQNYKNIINDYKNGAIVNFCCPDCGKGVCAIKNIFTTRKPIQIEKKSADKKGRIYYHRLTFLPSISESGEAYQIVVSIRDITQSKIAEEEVRRLHKFNQKILDNSPVSILVLDRNGLIISANDMAIKLMKKKLPDIIGRKLMKTSSMKKNNELVLKYRQLLKHGDPVYCENLEYKAVSDDTLKYLNILAVPLLDNSGKIEGVISMAVDNTEATQAKLKLSELNCQLEQKVIDRTRELNNINKRLSIMLDLKSKFVADASHEIRTPLTVIQGNLDLAVREAEYENKKTPELYEIIMYEVARMRNILTDLTVLTNVDSENEQLAYEKVYIKNLIKAVAQSMSVLAKQKGILLMCQKRLGNLALKGDEAKLEKLLLNLVRNAIKYTNEGGKVKIAIKKADNSINISVEDTGIGVPEDEIDFIFERFYRVDQSRNSNEGGTGLGLSIAKWIAEAHGGKISVTSKVGVGSKFMITLPCDRKKENEPKKQAWLVKRTLKN